MRKWTLGVRALLALTALLFIFTLYNGITTRQDRQTYLQAVTIAEKVNTYADSYQTAPASLSAAGAKNAPATISYSKLSKDSYKFCQTYKTANKDVRSQVQNDITAATTGAASFYAGSSSYSPTQYYLVVSPDHKAGQTCQTIILLPSTSVDKSTSGASFSTNPADPAAACYSIVDNTAYQQCLDKAYGIQN